MNYFGCFVNDLYMPCFKVLIKSIKYYMNTARMVVYNYDTLTEENKKYILDTQICEIIEVPAYIKEKKNYWCGCAWRPIILKHMGCKYNSMLFVDIDMVILDDLTDIFKYIEDGNFVGSNEWTYDTLHHTEEQKKQLDKFNDDIFPLISERYDKPIKIYNGGLIGLNWKYHSELINSWGSSFDFFDIPNDLTNDQFVLSFLIQFTNTNIINLDCKYYMNTWANHSNPRKLMGFDSGKICLYNSDDIKNRIRVYHFTGDIGMVSNSRPFVTWRYFHYNGDYEKTPELNFYTKSELKLLSKELWETRHSSPVLQILKYFDELH